MEARPDQGQGGSKGGAGGLLSSVSRAALRGRTAMTFNRNRTDSSSPKPAGKAETGYRHHSLGNFSGISMTASSALRGFAAGVGYGGNGTGSGGGSGSTTNSENGAGLGVPSRELPSIRKGYLLMLNEAGQGWSEDGGCTGSSEEVAAGGRRGARAKEWSERFFYLSGHFLRYKKQSRNLTSVNLKQTDHVEFNLQSAVVESVEVANQREGPAVADGGRGADSGSFLHPNPACGKYAFRLVAPDTGSSSTTAPAPAAAEEGEEREEGQEERAGPWSPSPSSSSLRRSKSSPLQSNASTPRSKVSPSRTRVSLPRSKISPPPPTSATMVDAGGARAMRSSMLPCEADIAAAAAAASGDPVDRGGAEAEAEGEPRRRNWMAGWQPGGDSGGEMKGVFGTEPRRKVWVLAATNSQERAMWMQAIREAISLGHEFLSSGEPGCEAGSLVALATRMSQELEVRDRHHRLRYYRSCFLGEDAVSWLQSECGPCSVEEALACGNRMVAAGLIYHCTYGHSRLENSRLFYKFANSVVAAPSGSTGATSRNAQGGRSAAAGKAGRHGGRGGDGASRDSLIDGSRSCSLPVVFDGNSDCRGCVGGGGEGGGSGSGEDGCLRRRLASSKGGGRRELDGDEELEGSDDGRCSSSSSSSSSVSVIGSGSSFMEDDCGPTAVCCRGEDGVTATEAASREGAGGGLSARRKRVTAVAVSESSRGSFRGTSGDSTGQKRVNVKKMAMDMEGLKLTCAEMERTQMRTELQMQSSLTALLACLEISMDRALESTAAAIALAILSLAVQAMKLRRPGSPTAPPAREGGGWLAWVLPEEASWVQQLLLMLLLFLVALAMRFHLLGREAIRLAIRAASDSCSSDVLPAGAPELGRGGWRREGGREEAEARARAVGVVGVPLLHPRQLEKLSRAVIGIKSHGGRSLRCSSGIETVVLGVQLEQQQERQRQQAHPRSLEILSRMASYNREPICPSQLTGCLDPLTPASPSCRRPLPEPKSARSLGAAASNGVGRQGSGAMPSPSKQSRGGDAGDVGGGVEGAAATLVKKGCRVNGVGGTESADGGHTAAVALASTAVAPAQEEEDVVAGGDGTGTDADGVRGGVDYDGAGGERPELASLPPEKEWPHHPIFVRLSPSVVGQVRLDGHLPNSSIPVNSEDIAVPFETPLFQGRLLVRVAGLPGDGGGAQDYFRGKRRLMQCAVQGQFKKELPFDRAYTGQAYTRPFTKLPAKWLIRSAFSLIRRLSPALREDITGERPYMVSPLAATAQAIRAEAPGDEVAIVGDLSEETRLLGSSFMDSCVPASARKRFFSSLRNLQAYSFKPGVVYTFDFYQHLYNAVTFELDLGFRKVKLADYLNHQPAQIMALDFETGEMLWNVEIWNAALLKATGMR